MISVCITTYNGENYIKQELESILKQLDKNDEVIISDDNSNDNTIGVIKSLNDSRIKIFQHTRTFSKKAFPNGYYCSNNFSNAIEKASGDYIFLADQDDIWRENKVEKFVEKLNEYDVCMSNFSIIDSSGNILNEKHFLKNPISGNWFSNFNKNVYFGCSMAFKSSIKDLFMPIPKSIVSYDTWIATKALLSKRKIVFIEEALLFYRRHENNVSPATGVSKNPLWFKLYWRIQFLITLICK